MEINKILEALAQRHKGTMMRICYKTEPALTALAKKQGYSVEKVTESTVRFGCKYSNMKRVIAQRTEDVILGTERKHIPAWWTWEKESIIKQHNTKPDKYLTVASVPYGNNTITHYFVDGKELLKKELQNMGIIINSYWEEKDPVTYDININNIIEIKPKTIKYAIAKKN